jgi:hypothetical protein
MPSRSTESMLCEWPRSHVVAWEPASIGRRSSGATIDLELCGSTGARLNNEVEFRSHHGPGAT